MVLGITPRQNHQDQPPAVTSEAESQTVQMPTVVFPYKKNIATVLLCPISDITTLSTQKTINTYLQGEGNRII